MLQQGEVTNLALHCGLATPEFAMARIHLIMRMSEQGDREGDASGTGKSDRFAADGSSSAYIEGLGSIHYVLAAPPGRYVSKTGVAACDEASCSTHDDTKWCVQSASGGSSSAERAAST